MNTKIAPSLKGVYVDKLSFTLEWGNEVGEDQSAMLKPVKARIQKAIEAGSCVRTYPRGSRYIENFKIVLDGTDAFVQIGALQPHRQNGGVRVELNPAKALEGDVDHLHTVMSYLLGKKSYTTLLNRPALNKIDFAADFVGADLQNLSVGYQHAQRTTIFGKRISSAGKIEGYNFGSVTSDYMAAVYDKSAERRHRAILNIAKSGVNSEELTQNLIKQLPTQDSEPCVLRIEVRGRKMRGRHPSTLGELPNRFERFKIADLSGTDEALSELIKVAFHALCEQRGFKSALEAFKHSKHARKVNAYWRSVQAEWWQPADLWRQACDALRETKVFPLEAFDRID